MRSIFSDWYNSSPLATAQQRSFCSGSLLWVVLVGVLCCGVVTPAQANKNASLALASKPAGCSFEILDGTGKTKAKGTTPFVGVLPAGRYMIKLQKAGFFTEQRGLLLKPGQQRVVQITLMASGKPSARPAPVVRATPRARPAPARAAPAKRREPVAPAKRREPPPARREATPAAARPTPTRPAPARSVPARPAPARPAPTRPTPARVVPARVVPARPAARRTAAKPVDQRPSPNTTTITPPSAKAKKTKKEKPKAGRKIPWIPLAAAAGLGIAGAIFWGLSGGSLSASEDRTKFQRDAFREYQQGRTHRSTAVFLLAAGGAALGLAGVFYFWNPSKRKKKKQLPDNSTAIGQLSGTPHVAPTSPDVSVILSTP